MNKKIQILETYLEMIKKREVDKRIVKRCKAAVLKILEEEKTYYEVEEQLLDENFGYILPEMVNPLEADLWNYPEESGYYLFIEDIIDNTIGVLEFERGEAEENNSWNLLSKETIKELRNLINEKIFYRSGPEIVEFFINLGVPSEYSRDFPSRWQYTEKKLEELNGTLKIKECIEEIFNPINFINDEEEYLSLLGTFNKYLLFDDLKIIRFKKKVEVVKSDVAEEEMMGEKKANSLKPNNKNSVFIVHGRDDTLKLEVARYVESLGLKAIILHEQVNSGLTIIEKIEHYTNEADFGIILYTPCDQGRGHHEKRNPPKDRARQNVILEHGYLLGKLGRRKVFPLVKGELELPNDISGLVYTSVQEQWQEKLRNELKGIGYKIT